MMFTRIATMMIWIVSVVDDKDDESDGAGSYDDE